VGTILKWSLATISS